MILGADENALRKAGRIVREGGLVIYPTDTVYGVGCDPFNVEAVKRLIVAKGREGKPLPILASCVERAERIAVLTNRARGLASKFWPGPLTLVLKKRKVLPDTVTADRDTVGVRVPNNKIALSLLEQVRGLIIGTSANKSGGKPPITAVEAGKQLGRFVDVILDGGPVQLGQPSTVVDVTGERVRLLREGPISMVLIAEASR